MRRLHEQGKLNVVHGKLFADRMDPEELYDLDTDPHEIVNLATSPKPENQTALKRLRGELENWIAETNDQGRNFKSAEEIRKYEDSAKSSSRRTFKHRFNDKPDTALTKGEDNR